MTRKLTARKHVHAPPHRNDVPTESHSDGQHAGYLPRTLQTLLLALGYSEPLLFIGVPRLLEGNSYFWRVCVIIYERPTTDHIRHIHHVVKATTPKWTFEGGMREFARVLAVIKCIYLLPTYLYFIQNIEDRCLLLTSSTTFVDLPFQEHRMTENHHMDQNPCISSLCLE
jgi:hypothetical protein